jgi:branched-chain amino acid transport system substrate-binding protein
MICNGRTVQLAAAAIAACGMLASAPASAQGVKIGVLNDQSGVFADFDGKWSVEAAKMAIEDFGGSVLGEKIELVSADHQNKLDLASAIARRWYDAEGVDVITDLTLSSVALAVQGIAAERKKIDIVVASSTSALTGQACTPYGFHWAYDTHAIAVSTGGALVKAGADTWYFITVDYAAGHAQEKDASEIITSSGGKVLGRVLFPLNTPDFSSFLLQAQSSKAKIVALATGGQDIINAIKQRLNSASSPAASGSQRCC